MKNGQDAGKNLVSLQTCKHSPNGRGCYMLIGKPASSQYGALRELQEQALILDEK